MMPQHIFVTGGTGFFGKSILDYRLRNRDFLARTNLTILSRDPSAFQESHPDLANQPGITWIKGDVCDLDLNALDRFSFDAILHAAALLNPAASEAEIRTVALAGTRNVIALAKRQNCRKLLLTSSGAVYGPTCQPVSENHPMTPATPYGKAKLDVERLCVESGVPTLITRCFAFTGHHLDRKIYYAIGNFIQDSLDNKPIVIKGDGTPLRSYLYADDLVEWLFAILDRGEPGRPYNVGSPHGLSIRELAETVRDTLGTANDIQVLGRPAGTPPSVYVPDTSRAMRELDLEVKVNLPEAIRLSAARNP